MIGCVHLRRQGFQCPCDQRVDFDTRMVSRRGKRQSNGGRACTEDTLEIVFDVNADGIIRFAIARARRVRLRFFRVLLTAAKHSLFRGRP